MAKGVMCVLLLFLLSAASAPTVTSDGGGPEGQYGLLVDFGNGRTQWHDLNASGDLESAISASLPAGAVTYGDDGGVKVIGSVEGVANLEFGTGSSRLACGWKVYSWNTVEWEYYTSDVSERCPSGHIALGFYPNHTLKPASNPEFREVWTSYRGDSVSSGVSTSRAPGFVSSPLEWYRTYAGAVDSSILYADGMIYHTVSGKYGSVGMDSLARVNCLDPVNRELLWSVTYSDSGNIEITTPVIIGDLILVTSGNWHIYCLDRFTGEAVAELSPVGDPGDMCSGSRLTTYIPRKDHPSVSQDRIHLEAGVTNAVYDSGALYFCTSDGLMRCFSIDREKGFTEIWSHPPEDPYRGCFYYYPPVVCEKDGRRLVVSGNHGGSMVCKDAGDGGNVWAMKVRDLEGNAVGQVSSISVCSGGRALVCYSGGEMSSAGGVMLIDIGDGSVLWQKDIRMGKTTVVGDRFYAYVSSNGSGTVIDSQTGREVPVVSGYHSFWVDDCSMLWASDTDALTVGSITYCGGRLYSMDYSPGTEGALGGWVWCLDSDAGSVIWKVKVTPYSGSSYSMSAPTVVDGRVLVGNDYGAIYVLSETSGSPRAGSSEIDYASEGLAHWSWLSLAFLTAAAVTVAVVVYRR